MIDRAKILTDHRKWTDGHLLGDTYDDMASRISYTGLGSYIDFISLPVPRIDTFHLRETITPLFRT